MRIKALFLTLVAAITLAAQTPDTPATRQFKAWLAAFNSGQREELLKYLKEYAPSRAANVDREMSMREGTGGFDFLKIEEATDTKVTALIQERDGVRVARAVGEVEAAEPHRFSTFSLQVVPRPAEYAIARLSESELVAKLRTRIDDSTANGRFSGAVLVAHNGKPIFETAAGLADREAKTPNKLSTRFRMGSMNKMFTATSIMQLVEAGKIKLEAPLGTYLTDYPNKDVATKVTIHHLLTHTGGTGDIFGPEFDKQRLELRTLNDYVTLYGKRGLKFEPGSKWEYSNYGFLLLGVIIEKVSGQSYYDYVRDHIFRPAGMESSGSEPEDKLVPDRSKGYMDDGGVWKLNTDTLPYRGTSAGGGYTTVGDLLRFATALMNHKLLNAQNTERLTTGKVEARPGSKYAYGFFDESTAGGVRSIGHSGGAPGMNGDLRIYPESGYVVIALANIDFGAQRTTSWIDTRLPVK